MPSALVIGSMSPDAQYFVPLPIRGVESHSLAGILWLCLPASLVAYATFHLVAAPLCHRLLPLRLQPSVPGWNRGRLPQAPAVAVAASIVVGAATHVAWDSFTHSDGLVVSRFPALSTPLVSWQGYTLYVFKVLQHGSSVFGLGALLVWGTLRLPPAPPEQRRDAGRSLRIMGLVALVVPPLAVGGLSGAAHIESGVGLARQAQQFLGHGITAAGSAFLVSVLSLGLCERLAQRFRRRAV